jgi:hypothetical protein
MRWSIETFYQDRKELLGFDIQLSSNDILRIEQHSMRSGIFNVLCLGAIPDETPD